MTGAQRQHFWLRPPPKRDQRENKQIFVQATGQARLDAFPETTSKFFFKVIQATMEFIKDNQGKVTKMIFTQGPTLEAKKL